MFTRFNTVHECDKQTDRQTEVSSHILHFHAMRREILSGFDIFLLRKKTLLIYWYLRVTGDSCLPHIARLVDSNDCLSS